MQKPHLEASDPLLPPPLPPPPHCTSSRRCSSLLGAVSLIGLALLLLWPSDPEIRVARLRIDRIRVSLHPSVAVSVDLRLRIRVRNPDFFSLDYSALAVAVGYRGQRLGAIRSAGGAVRARSVSYVDAELRLDGIEVLHDVFYLIEDLARRSIPFDTITEVKGILHFLFLDIPIKGKLSCLVNVNPKNQTVIRQDCHPE